MIPVVGTDRRRETAFQSLGSAADAWREYLLATRSAGAQYDRIEPFAWARLTGKLRAIKETT